ncbi:MAG: YebC/PmpR family DNA-binding transcriptional regulator, partial [Clostridia bacterium]|nr:YebC/PmpR family DNA-binding transcriptional regulator [Clostridia bacterium]
IRNHFDKCGGAMGTSGCVSYMFETKGVIVVDAEGVDEDELMMTALDCGAEDILNDGDVFEIYTDPTALGNVRENLEKQSSLKILSADVDRIPNITVKPDADAQAKVLKLLDMLEDNDDVQNVYHNAELDEEEE